MFLPRRLLDRYSWDEKRVVELYRRSVERRKDLGMDAVKREIQRDNLQLDSLPHAKEVRSVISVNGSSSLEKVVKSPRGGSGSDGVGIDGKQVAYGDVIGCYEMRYGHGKPATGAGGGGLASTSSSESNAVSPDQFTRYMVYVTQWRWLQCEDYIRRHGELGFWSMIHDCSCPAGYISLWSRMRSLLYQYMPPVEEACAGLFPPMVQKILIINVPRIFGPMWSVLSSLLPKHHKDRIVRIRTAQQRSSTAGKAALPLHTHTLHLSLQVLLTTSYTSAEEVSKYVPEAHMPNHLKEGRPDGPDEAP